MYRRLKWPSEASKELYFFFKRCLATKARVSRELVVDVSTGQARALVTSQKVTNLHNVCHRINYKFMEIHRSPYPSQLEKELSLLLKRSPSIFERPLSLLGGLHCSWGGVNPSWGVFTAPKGWNFWEVGLHTLRRHLPLLWSLNCSRGGFHSSGGAFTAPEKAKPLHEGCRPT